MNSLNKPLKKSLSNMVYKVCDYVTVPPKNYHHIEPIRDVDYTQNSNLRINDSSEPIKTPTKYVLQICSTIYDSLQKGHSLSKLVGYINPNIYTQLESMQNAIFNSPQELKTMQNKTVEAKSSFQILRTRITRVSEKTCFATVIIKDNDGVGAYILEFNSKKDFWQLDDFNIM